MQYLMMVLQTLVPIGVKMHSLKVNWSYLHSSLPQISLNQEDILLQKCLDQQIQIL